jgi:hypothetical protein
MQLSLSTLFVVLGYCAVFCVAILNTGPVAVMILRGIAVVSLLFALLAVWYRRSERRAYWVGYLHGGGAYTLLTFYALGGVTEKPVWTDEQIVSGQLANLVYTWLPESKRVAAVVQQRYQARVSNRGIVLTAVPVATPPPNFRYLFHSAFIVFCGWLGGLVGVWAFKTRDGFSAAAVRQTDELRVTKDALLAIVKAPTVTNGDMKRKTAALRRLGMFVDSQDAVAVLLDEISFLYERNNIPSSPLENYPAAQSLAMGGSTVRSALLSVPASRFLTDKEVALRAHILVAIDGDLEAAIARLKRILARTTADSDGHAERRLNFGRILAYIEDPGFRPNQAIPDPLQEPK